MSASKLLSKLVEKSRRSLLGQQAKDYADAVHAWVALPDERRREWHLDKVVRATAFLSALIALRGNRPEEAVRNFRLAKQYGFDDSRLDPLFTAAQLLAARDVEPARAVKRLEKAAAGDAAPGAAPPQDLEARDLGPHDLGPQDPGAAPTGGAA